MSESEFRPGEGPAKDPTLFRAMVEYKLKHNTDRDEIINNLIGKGLTHGQAAALVDSVATRLEMARRSSPSSLLMAARLAGGALLGSLAGLMIVDQFFYLLPDKIGRPASYLLLGLLAAIGAVLAQARQKKTVLSPLLATLAALLASYWNAYMRCENFDVSFFRVFLRFRPLDEYMLRCMKGGVFEGRELYYAIAALVLAWLIASKQWIRPRIV
jgi:hypothetical protein